MIQPPTPRMIVRPTNRDELCSLLATASARAERIASVDLSGVAGLFEHKVEDMTARVEAGLVLADFQQRLRDGGQWLPLDPPAPDRLTVGELLATDANGPRRFGCGTVRDHLIGLTVALADGRLIRSGGNVVKNVAGYDLMKLFVGSGGSLGVIVEATFKLRPVPESEKFVQADCASLAQADELAAAVLDSDLTPTVLDLHNLPPTSPQLSLVLGFAGTVEEVDWQLAGAARLGFARQATLDYDNQFRGGNSALRKESVLPSKSTELLRLLDGATFVARFGNGIIYHNGPPRGSGSETGTGRSAGLSQPVAALTRRLKDEFDPKHILQEPSL